MFSVFQNENKRKILFLFLSGVSLVVSFFDIGGLPLDAAWLAILLCGLPIVKNAALALATEFDVKADLLVSLALIASVLIGEIFAAGEVAFIMTIGAMLEERTVAKARAGIEKLVRLIPRTARVVKNGEESVVSAELVEAGDLLRVRAGESVAVDGILMSGHSSIDQSVMTGESMPVDKGPGDPVFSGTVNQFGNFEMRAVKVGEDSSIQRMIRLVKSADAKKAKIVGTADKWATWIVAAALLSAIGTWFVTGETIRAVTILVVFCPCALVLATPTAVMAGIGNAAKLGILAKEGDVLERLAKVSSIAFDKTGTLTYGKPVVAAVERVDETLSDAAFLSVVASAEKRSEHPLGRAVVSFYREKTGRQPQEPQKFELTAGRGVSAESGGQTILAGNIEMLTEHSVHLPPELLKKANAYKDRGNTVIYVAIDGKAAGLVALADQLRHDAGDVVRHIGNIGLRTILMTGDNKQTALSIAGQAGIAEVYHECLPETKLRIIEKNQQTGNLVCMVGDGINDAPALKRAFVGIAMGGIGSDIAIDAADITLVGDDIKNLPHLLRLAKKTMRTIEVNLSLSMLLNFAAIFLAMAGWLTPVPGALLHNVGSVAVIVNSSLLLQWGERKPLIPAA